MLQVMKKNQFKFYHSNESSVIELSSFSVQTVSSFFFFRIPFIEKREKSFLFGNKQRIPWRILARKLSIGPGNTDPISVRKKIIFCSQEGLRGFFNNFRSKCLKCILVLSPKSPTLQGTNHIQGEWVRIRDVQQDLSTEIQRICLRSLL